MQLSKETIEEFKEIFRRKEGKGLTKQEALEIPSVAAHAKAATLWWTKSPQENLRRGPLLIELTYRQVELGGAAIPALDRAFDILFDEVLRRRESGVKACK